MEDMVLFLEKQFERNKPVNRVVCGAVVDTCTHTQEWRLNSFDTAERVHFCFYSSGHTNAFVLLFFLFFYWSILCVFEKKKEKNTNHTKIVCVCGLKQNTFLQCQKKR
jgi:hypothetical protein